MILPQRLISTPIPLSSPLNTPFPQTCPSLLLLIPSLPSTPKSLIHSLFHHLFHHLSSSSYLISSHLISSHLFPSHPTHSAISLLQPLFPNLSPPTLPPVPSTIPRIHPGSRDLSLPAVRTESKACLLKSLRGVCDIPKLFASLRRDRQRYWLLWDGWMNRWMGWGGRLRCEVGVSGGYG